MSKSRSGDRHEGSMVNVRLDAELFAALAAVCAKEDRTRASIIKRALALYAVRYGHSWPVPAPDLELAPNALGVPPAPAGGPVS